MLFILFTGVIRAESPGCFNILPEWGNTFTDIELKMGEPRDRVRAPADKPIIEGLTFERNFNGFEYKVTYSIHENEFNNVQYDFDLANKTEDEAKLIYKKIEDALKCNFPDKPQRIDLNIESHNVIISARIWQNTDTYVVLLKIKRPSDLSILVMKKTDFNDGAISAFNELIKKTDL